MAQATLGQWFSGRAAQATLGGTVVLRRGGQQLVDLGATEAGPCSAAVLGEPRAPAALGDQVPCSPSMHVLGL